ncbi:unnamed protein product [Linum trigynum]|uniref:Uncharacterized protein n=1 Tax=Linum trigynum TaxID=586398 RepID=A0AAV2G704_9ROSI
MKHWTKCGLDVGGEAGRVAKVFVGLELEAKRFDWKAPLWALIGEGRLDFVRGAALGLNEGYGAESEYG